MAKIKIVADSLSDVPKRLEEELDIEILPLTVIFPEGEYKDGKNLSPQEFYDKLKASTELPRTSQITPMVFEEAFERILKDYDEILYIGGSSRASGTYQSSTIAKANFPDAKIETFDSMALSFGIGMMVVEAAKMAKNGKTMEEILQFLKEDKDNVDYIFTVDTLEYLQKGGRISSTKAAIGTLLNIKPVLTVKDGLVEAVDQVRGKKKIIEKMISIAKENGSDLQNQIMAIAHASNPELAEKLREEVTAQLNPKEIIMTEMGPSIGTHAGPGTVALFFRK